MAAQQFITAAYDAIWALLTAHTGFTSNVRAGNRLNWTTGQAEVKRFGLGSKAPSDYAEVSLELGGFIDTGYSLTANYGMRNPAVPVSSLVWTEEYQQDFTLTIVTDAKRITVSQLVELETLTALRKGGPRLGLSTVAKWGPVTGERAFESTDDTGNIVRPVTRMTIPVLFRFNGQDLLT